MKKTHCCFLTCLTVFALLSGLSAPAFAETEQNNTIATANVVDMGTGVVLKATESGTLSPNVPSDVVDIYKFTLPTDGMLQIGAVPVAELDLYVQFLDTGGVALIAEKNDQREGGTEGIVYTHIRAGTYYAVIGLAQGTGAYDVTFTFAQVAEKDAEPNNSPSTAAVLEANGEVEGHVGYFGSQFSDYLDYYRVTTPEDGELELTVFPDGDLNVSLQLLDTNATDQLVWQEQAGNGGSEKIVYGNLAVGTYFVSVWRRDGSGSYTLTSQHTALADPDDPEPNDILTQAVEIPLAANTADPVQHVGSAQGRLGYFGNQYQDDEDYYKLSTPVYGNLTFSFESNSESDVARGYNVYDGAMREIHGWTTSGDITLNGLQPGQYYVRLGRSDRYGSYTLTCTLDPQEAPQPFSEPAGELAPNGTVTDVLISEAVPNVYYRIQLPQDGLLTVRSRHGSGPDIETYLFAADGESRLSSIRSWGSTDEKVMTFPDLRAGTYIALLSRRGGEGLATLTTEFTPVTKLDAESNDTYLPNIDSAALNTTLDNEPVFSGHIGYGGNGYRDYNDFFLLDIRDDGQLGVTTTGEGTLDYEIYLYEFRGFSYSRVTNVRSWGSADPKSIGENDILAGPHVLQVVRRGGYGSYDIAISFVPNRSKNPEPNDHAPWQATSIALGQGVVGHLGYDFGYHEDGDDWYILKLPADGTLSVYAVGDSTLDYQIYLYYPDAYQEFSNSRSWNSADVRSVGRSSLRAGTYYARVMLRGGYGTYQFYSVFNEQPAKDVRQNNFSPMAQPLALGTITQGALGYQTNTVFDREDWNSVQIPSDGTYKMSFQTEPGLDAEAYLYASDMRTRIHSRRTWNNSSLYEQELELTAGTYYLQTYYRGGVGRYTLRLGDVAGPAVGTLSGTVSDVNSFPLFEMEVQIRDHIIKTDFAGEYSFANLPPGKYRVQFRSGAKYYAWDTEVEIRAGENTVLNATMLDANKSAPYDVKYLFGIPNDRYVHVFWSPSESPDVADGGGYKVYIDSQEPIDLGNLWYYRTDGFENGRAYTFRVTVYDKFGNESAGRTIQVTPVAVGPGPTPTPTPIGPTATPTPFGPTATPTPVGPTATPTEGPVVTPTATLTPTPPVVVELIPFRVFPFETIDEFNRFPGGFIDALPGDLKVGPILGSSDGFTDGVGATVTAPPDSVELLMFPMLDIGDHVAILRVSVQATAPGAAVAIAALDGTMDGSIATNIPANSQIFMGEYKRLTLVYDPPGTTIYPVIQIANLGGTSHVQIYLDNLEIYLIPRELGPLARLLYGE